MLLSQFEFVITYQHGKQQGLSDALLRKSYFVPKAGEATFDQQCMTLLKPKQFKICVVVIPINADFLNQVCTATIKASIALDIKQHVNDDKFKVEGDLLYFEERLYIPNDQHGFEFSNPVTIFQLQDILDLTRPWSSFREISGGSKCGRM